MVSSVAVALHLSLMLWGDLPSPDAVPTSFQLAGREIRVEGDLGPFRLDVVTGKIASGIEIATLRLSAPNPAPPPAAADESTDAPDPAR